MKKSKDKESLEDISKKEEIPVINPSFIPEPGLDRIGNDLNNEECPHYSDPIPGECPTEISENGMKEF